MGGNQNKVAKEKGGSYDTSMKIIRCRNLSFLGAPDYKVRSDGSVWVKRKKAVPRWKKLKPIPHGTMGYLGVELTCYGKRKYFTVHSLVLMAFVGPRPVGANGKLMDACHFPDKDVANNNLNNLRWDTRKNNHKDKYKHGTMACGERQGLAKLTEHDIKQIRASYQKGVRGCGCKTLAKQFGVWWGTIYTIVTRKTWKHI